MRALRIGLTGGIDEVRANVILHDLSHQPVDSAAGAGNELQHVSATNFLIERPFDGFHLSANAPHAIEEFGLFANGVGHCRLRRLLLCYHQSTAWGQQKRHAPETGAALAWDAPT